MCILWYSLLLIVFCVTVIPAAGDSALVTAGFCIMFRICNPESESGLGDLACHTCPALIRCGSFHVNILELFVQKACRRS